MGALPRESPAAMMNRIAELETSTIPTTTRNRSRCNTRKAPEPKITAITMETARITRLPPAAQGPALRTPPVRRWCGRTRLWPQPRTRRRGRRYRDRREPGLLAPACPDRQRTSRGADSELGPAPQEGPAPPPRRGTGEVLRPL